VKRLGRIIALAALVAATASATASAYVVDTDGNGHLLHWERRTVSYRMVAGNVPGGASGEAAVHNAFNAWSGISGNLNYQFDGFVAAGAQSYDSRNLVYWVYGGWAYDPTLLAITFRFFDRASGKLLDADILFNAQRYGWSVGGSNYDIENSAAHEVGHFGGLGHSTDGEATMFASARPGETKKRSLNGDDVAGFSSLYGGGTPATSGGGVVSNSPSGVDGGGGGGGCSIDATGNGRDAIDMLPFAGLLLGLLIRRRRSADCDSVPALSASAGDATNARLSVALGGSIGVQHERGSRQALFGSRTDDCVLGSRI